MVILARTGTNPEDPEASYQDVQLGDLRNAVDAFVSYARMMTGDGIGDMMGEMMGSASRGAGRQTALEN